MGNNFKWLHGQLLKNMTVLENMSYPEDQLLLENSCLPGKFNPFSVFLNLLSPFFFQFPFCLLSFSFPTSVILPSSPVQCCFFFQFFVFFCFTVYAGKREGSVSTCTSVFLCFNEMWMHEENGYADREHAQGHNRRNCPHRFLHTRCIKSKGYDF